MHKSSVVKKAKDCARISLADGDSERDSVWGPETVGLLSFSGRFVPLIEMDFHHMPGFYTTLPLNTSRKYFFGPWILDWVIPKPLVCSVGRALLV